MFVNYNKEWARSICREVLLGLRGDHAVAAEERGHLHRHRQLARRVALNLVLIHDDLLGVAFVLGRL